MSGTVHKVDGLNCPNCGAPLTIRGFGHTLTVVCPNCHSILDAKDPKLQVLQQFQARVRIEPAIPLGTRGKLHGDPWEVIGFQVRTTTDEGVDYHWREYVLFNPYKGFRYLTEYDGHWNDVKAIDSVPQPARAGARPAVALLGAKFTHFQSGRAATSYVLGEFPWQVRVGEQVEYRDYIAPPRVLSSETSGEETTWSLGEYMEPRRVWEAFQLKGNPPPALGIFENQPAPAADLGGMWSAAMLLLLSLAVMALGFSTFDRNEEVFRRGYTFGQGTFVTDTFELKGRPSVVEIDTRAGSSTEAYFHYALIDSGTGHAYDFGRELTDGSDTALLSRIPAGQYYLRVEPEVQSAAPGQSYEIVVRRDVSVLTFYWIAAVLLLIPPALRTFRAGSFEQRRWQQSDYVAH
jgi:hypothetical protein